MIRTIRAFSLGRFSTCKPCLISVRSAPLRLFIGKLFYYANSEVHFVYPFSYFSIENLSRRPGASPRRKVKSQGQNA